MTRPTKTLKSFITRIRFPNYKNMAPNSEITFDSQFTVMVGANGSGKTSVLQALFGCPNRYSTAKFWFSTSMDPIVDGGGETGNRFIYEYTLPTKKPRSVEIIKIRRSREDNPDYWETARPQVRDNMELEPKVSDEERNFRTKTNERWVPVRKPVVYIDFKAEISAFDRFFNFGCFIERKTINSKQDYLRLRSKALRNIIDGKSKGFHGKTVRKTEKLSRSALNDVSKILGKEYSEATIVYHDLFETYGMTILFKQKDHGYTEAVAGSGEVAVVSCVKQVVDAKPLSLILMDEPEVSLHPGAQSKLKEFLLREIEKKEHQIVITTHSSSFVNGLPRESIKVFYQRDDGKFDVIPESEPEQAFVRLGDETYSGIDIIVEDELMKGLVVKALDSLCKDDEYNVKVYPGGGEAIKGTIINPMVADRQVRKVLVLLDGDQRKHTEGFNFADIKECQRSNIDKLATEHIGRKLTLPEPSNDDKDKLEKKFLLYKEAIMVYDYLFFFGNTDIPEELLWEVSGNQIIDSVKSEPAKDYYKRMFIQYVANEGGVSTEEIKASDIFWEQRKLIKNIDVNHERWKEFVSIVRNITNVKFADIKIF
ncbi:MAG: energy-coupling factor transporter ATP-binding protein EcfA2 [Cocleimonas sp.]|jgi:energy-coupling factor transporter ATP-binding protein EcfA2